MRVTTVGLKQGNWTLTLAARNTKSPAILLIEYETGTCVGLVSMEVEAKDVMDLKMVLEQLYGIVTECDERVNGRYILGVVSQEEDEVNVPF